MSNQITIQGKLSFNQSNDVAATVKLWAANVHTAIGECIVTEEANGEFILTGTPGSADAILYIIAELHSSKVVLLSVLSPNFKEEIATNGVVVNELTTVASAFTCAQFFSGLQLSGNLQGVKIAAKNTPNLVNPVTGTWGDVLTDPFNITQNETLARLNTLAALITAYGTVISAGGDWQTEFLDFSTPLGGKRPENTAGALIGIAQAPWAFPTELFALFDKAYPQPKDGFPAKPNSKVPVSRRSAPFVPYLSFAPEDFAMILVFGQGGICAPGKLALDEEGNLWTGLNWMAGAQNGVYQGIGGGLVKLDSTGKLVSPPVTGYTGMGVDGVGWGTAVTNVGTCWVTSFNGAIGVHKLEDGSPALDEVPENLAETLTEFGGLQGIGVAPNGDIWITGTSSNEMLYFPGGDLSKGKAVAIMDQDQKTALSAPFAVSIDNSNRVWISNTNSKSLIRYTPSEESPKVERFILAGGGRGVALDSKGNCWIACNTSPDFPPITPTDYISIIEGFALGYPHLEQTLGRNRKTGSVFMIPSDANPMDTIDKTTHESDLTPFGDGELNAPWGISVDGNDDVWVANFMGRGVSFMAGASASKRTEAFNTGDVIHTIHSGSIQMLTDVIVDQAGNLWCANNWNLPQTVMQAKPDPAYSTWGGGSGVLVVYGIAKPVRVPLVGPVSGF
ncbi:Virginiamycin B lyase [compost metagenome]